MSRPRPGCFLSCDWGTSSFRFRLVEVESLDTLAATSEGDGILATYRTWLASGRTEEERVPFYLSRLRDRVEALAREAGISLEGVPVVVSGMVSASIGMSSLAYKKLPLAVDGTNLVVSTIPASSAFRHPLVIVSGACTDADVMRGEETLLIGALDHAGGDAEECLVILPGTHSKHITVRHGWAVDFTTYMTGEFFALLSRESILSHAMEAGGSLESTENRDGFVRGVRDGERGELLHECFSIRARHLLEGTSPPSNYFRLSGLLIGAELKGVMTRDPGKILLVSGHPLLPFYETALRTLRTDLSVSSCVADDALVRGQRIIARRAGLLPSSPSI